MSDHIFEDAYGRVRARHSDQEWFSLTPRQITEAIYREMRVIDQERLAAAEPPSIAVAAE